MADLPISMVIVDEAELDQCAAGLWIVHMEPTISLILVSIHNHYQLPAWINAESLKAQRVLLLGVKSRTLLNYLQQYAGYCEVYLRSEEEIKKHGVRHSYVNALGPFNFIRSQFPIADELEVIVRMYWAIDAVCTDRVNKTALASDVQRCVVHAVENFRGDTMLDRLRSLTSSELSYNDVVRRGARGLGLKNVV